MGTQETYNFQPNGEVQENGTRRPKEIITIQGWGKKTLTYNGPFGFGKAPKREGTKTQVQEAYGLVLKMFSSFTEGTKMLTKEAYDP